MTTDDLLAAHPERARRIQDRLGPKIIDAEMLTLAVVQAGLRFTNETRWR